MRRVSRPSSFLIDFRELRMTTSTYTHAENRFVEIRGRRIAYRSVGTGKPLLLCLRFRGTMDSWDPAFIDVLARQGLQVITFDYPGLGLSEGTPNYSPATLADDARDLIVALGLEKPAIGGWSLGGLAVQVFMARHGALVSHVVLLGTVPAGPNVKGAEQLFNDTARKDHNDLDDQVVLFFEPRSEASRAAARRSLDRISERTEGRSPEVPVEFARSVLGETPRSPLFPADPVLQALKSTPLPVLHVGGDHDIAFPVENWYALNGQLPTVTLVTLPSTGHAPHHQYPRQAAGYVASFVLGEENA